MSYLWYWPDGGWDFDAWKKKYPWTPVTGPQTGISKLNNLLQGIDSRAEWREKRAEWLAITSAILGTVTDIPPAKPAFEVLSSEALPGYQRQRIRYRLTDAEWGYAWYLIPKDGAGPRPTVIALHQTMPQGKDEVVGISGDPELAYGKELVEEGFVVFAPDVIAFGERKKDHENALYHSADAFFRAHPDGSVMGKMVYDMQRAVDLLETMPEVDAKRIGCIGHSHGGYGTLFPMIFEPRIQAGVISCGVAIMRSDPMVYRWWRSTALMPRLGCYEDDITQTPLDFHYFLGMLAPRRLMLVAALKDDCFPDTDNLKEVSDMLEGVYGYLDARGKYKSYIFDGSHSFPKEARKKAYKMLRKM